MNTFRRSLLLGLTAALTLGGCTSKPELSRIQDPDVDFNSYRTFMFFPGRATGYPALVERHLVAAARSELERRGYVFDESAPDMLVTIAAVVEERQVRKVHGKTSGSEVVETEDYRLGRLAIDLYDARRHEIIWHGAAEGRLSEAMMRDAGAAAEKAVVAIMKGFPVKPNARAAAPAQAASAPVRPAVRRPAIGQAT